MSYDSLLRKAGELADQVELYIQKEKSLIVRLDKGLVKSSSTIEDSGASIRCFKAKSLGTAYTTDLSQEGLLRAASVAAKLASSAVPDPEFTSLPTPSKPKGNSLRNYSTTTAEANVQEVAKKFLESAEIAQSFSKKVYSVSGAMEAEVCIERVLNTLGVDFTRKVTYASATLETVAKHDDDQATGLEYFDSHNIDEIDFERLGKNSAQQAVKLLGAQKMETAEMPLVLDPLAANTILASIADAVNGENVVNKRSYFFGKKGQKVGSDLLTIHDDPFVPGRSSSRNFDHEGTSTRRVNVINSGVLESWLHNSYSAAKAREANTGNAYRFTYRDGVSIAPTNLILKPGKGSAEDFVKDVQKGVYLILTGDRPNEASGDLSALVLAGFKIQNGELVYPLKDTLIGTNMLDLLKNVTLVGSDTRVMRRSQSPSIVIEKVKVSSGK